MSAPHRAFRFALLILSLSLSSTAVANDANFESAPVHPVELSPSGNLLFVAHTADHRMVTFNVQGPTPIRIGETMVGIEPVTVRARAENEVWVVNHVSRSISIVDVLTRAVVRTLNVGDDPTDVVFANNSAFVCVSQEDLIRVYDLNNLDAAPVDIPLEMSDPRSLALSPLGGELYVTSLDSGNKTTVIHFEVVDALGGPPPSSPPMNPLLPPPPRVSLIVQHNGTNWVDDTGGNWDAAVPYTMPDNDVVVINTSSKSVTNAFQGVGTTLFNVAVHPTSGDLWVTNQEAFNLTRFEPNAKGKFVQNRISHIDPSGGVVTPHHLNAHINYGVPDGDPSERALSLSTPMDAVVSGTGEIYVASFGSDKVGVVDAAGNVTRRINVGAGPAGLALDEGADRLYVFNRFTSSLSMVDLTDDSSIEVSVGFDPTAADVRDGRAVFYSGENSSAHGDLSCASCHVFGRMDNIAWDLGDPTASTTIPVPPGQIPGLPDFHPMKGPMTTQTLQDLTDTQPFHWRGDREDLVDFNPAFVGLMGRQTELSPGDFALFEAFVLSIRYPSNPFRELDGNLPAMLNGQDPIHGETLFLTGNLVGGANCVDCHALPTGENGIIIPGPALAEDEGKVVPQLRNMYEKTRFDVGGGSTVRGYGFIHDGSVKDVFEFLQFPAFTFASDNDRRDVEAFLLAFDTGTHRAIGAQWTMTGSNGASSIS